MQQIDSRLKTLVEQWFYKSRQDLWMGKTTIEHPDAPFDIIAFHAQQAVEKCIKGLLTFHQIDFPKTHDINELVVLLNKAWDPLPKPIKNADELTDYAILTRYPHEFEELSQSEAENALNAAIEIYNLSLDHLSQQGLTIPE